jgi:hypothetical protein
MRDGQGGLRTDGRRLPGESQVKGGEEGGEEGGGGGRGGGGGGGGEGGEVWASGRALFCMCACVCMLLLCVCC